MRSLNGSPATNHDDIALDTRAAGIAAPAVRVRVVVGLVTQQRRPRSFRCLMIDDGLASKTCTPAHVGTSAVNRPCSSIGHDRLDAGRVGDRRSGRPHRRPGAMCTTPVPSSVVTKSAAEHAEGVLGRGRTGTAARRTADEVAALAAVPTRPTRRRPVPSGVPAEARLGDHVPLVPPRPPRPRSRSRGRRRRRGSTAGSTGSSSRPDEDAARSRSPAERRR